MVKVQWALCLSVAAHLVFSGPAYSLSSVEEIVSDRLDAPAASGAAYEIPPEHWTYKLVQRLLSKPEAHPDDTIMLDGEHSVTRTEMAVLLSDLTGQVSHDLVLDEREKAQFEILQEEFKGEMKVLKGRIQKVEQSVEHLSGEVRKSLAHSENAVQAGNYSPIQFYGQFHVWNTIGLNDTLEEKNFKLRRTNIGMKGNLSEDFKFNVMFDPARSEKILKDLWLDYDGIPHHTVRFGQMKPGVTADSLRSSSRNFTAARSQIGRIGNEREQGMALLGQWKYLDYQLGLYNGNGENRTDTNNKYALGGRITLRPLAGVMNEEKWGRFELGGSYFDGQAGTNDLLTDRDRYGLEARYHHNKFQLNTEYMAFENPGGIEGHGWYAEGIYKLTPKFDLVARYDRLDPNRLIAANSVTEYILGFNYLVEKYNIRLGLNYILVTDPTGQNRGNAVRMLVQHTF